jgi:hypothetical protein
MDYSGEIDVQQCGERGVFPLPGEERVRVRGFEPIERAYPLTPPLSPWEREPTGSAA